MLLFFVLDNFSIIFMHSLATYLPSDTSHLGSEAHYIMPVVLHANSLLSKLPLPQKWGNRDGYSRNAPVVSGDHSLAYPRVYY